jgi:uncharacterized protein YggE
MKRRLYILLVLIVAPLLIAPLLAQQPPQPDRSRGDYPPTIVVTGDSEVFATPDLAVVTLGAVAQAPDAVAAQNQVNQQMQKVIDAIKATGVPEEKIKTTGLSLSPVYTGEGMRVERGEPRISGYRATNAVEIRLDDPKSAGNVIDAGMKAGANQLQGLWFSLKDDAKQRQQALEQAVKEASNKAKALATALNVKLGAIQLVTEEFGGGAPRPFAMAREAMVMDTPVQPGQAQVTAHVSVTYRISE